MCYLLLSLLSVPLFADEPDVHLSGDERIMLLPIRGGAEFSGTANYCVWLKQQTTENRSWRVKLLMPDGGMLLRPAGHRASPVPFEILVQRHVGAPFSRVRTEEVMLSGDRLVSHCGTDGSSFQLMVQPTMATELIAGGSYQQRLRMALLVDGMESQIIEVPLVLQVRELISATLNESSLSLPTFDGRTTPVGSVGLCLFRNGGGDYAVRLQGDGERGQFQLMKGQVAIAYQPHWQINGQPWESPQPGQQSRTYQGSTFRDCRGADNATVHVVIPLEEARKAASGRYRGRLRIIVQAR